MTAPKTILIASLALCAAVGVANIAQAEGFKFGGSGNNSNGKSSFKFNIGGNSGSHGQFKKYSSCHNDFHDYHHHHVRYVQPVRLVYSQCYHPQFSGCYVFPGDTWYSISRRVYGVDFLCKHIASYNGLSMFSPLVPGQMLRLPVVNANGSLAMSNAPIQAPLAPQGSSAGFVPQATPISGMSAASAAPQGPTSDPPRSDFATPNAEPAASVTPAANIRTVKDEPTLPRVAIGTTLMLDGESLGDEKGSVRLQMGALALPVEVTEWTNSSVKISLPKMELGRPVKASLEVLRADGSLASKSEIELTPAATRLALGN